MDTIFVNFRPFVYEQDILFYSNGTCVDQIKVPVNRIVEIINGVKNKYDIKQVNLCGNSNYLQKLKAELKLKFTNNDIKINIIQK